jgi:hypothetical protein
MGQIAQDKDRVYIGAQVDRRQRDELIRLARQRDRSVSSIIRRALAAELEREPKPQRGRFCNPARTARPPPVDPRRPHRELAW